jgi:hypothetical protein
MDDLHASDALLDADNDDAKAKKQTYLGIVRQLQQSDDGGTAQVKSLAGQLLAKHFFRFPEIQGDAIDALIGLSVADAKNPLSVRIHAMQSLSSMLSRQLKDTSVALVASHLMDKLAAFVQTALEKETSGVLLRHLTGLQKLIAQKQHQSPPVSFQPLSDLRPPCSSVVTDKNVGAAIAPSNHEPVVVPDAPPSIQHVLSTHAPHRPPPSSSSRGRFGDGA